MPVPFGTPGTSRFLIVPNLGYTHKGHTTMECTDVELDYFFLQNVSFNLAAQQYFFKQDGPDAVGLGAAATIRWHFVATEKGSLFVGAGPGLMYADHPVPADGSRFSLIPRAALGFTRELFGQTRLTAGVRLNYVVGFDARGSSSLTPQGFLGLSMPF
jgi:hypothetical protein